MSKFPCPPPASLTNKHTEWQNIKWRQCRHFARHLRQLTRTTRQLNASSSSFAFKFHFTTWRNFTHTQSTNQQTDRERNTESERVKRGQRGEHTQCQYWNLRAAVLCQIFCSPSTSCACCVIFPTMAQRTFINLLAFPPPPLPPSTFLHPTHFSRPPPSPSTPSHPYLSWKFDSENFSTIAVHFSAIALQQISPPLLCPVFLPSPDLT